MNVNIRNRFIVFGLVIVALFALLFIQLIQLTLVEGEVYAAAAEVLERREITVMGARGSILDRNGLPLAYDEKAYNVQFYRNPTKNTETDRAFYTSVIIDTINIVEKNGGETVDTFAIKYDETTGEYAFDWGEISQEAKVLREAEWRKNMYVNAELTVEQVYLFLRNKYQIPNEMSFDDAREILSIWQDVQLASWVAYKPVDVAYDVDIQTVAEIETHRVELEGMSVKDSTVRIYPRAAVAAHIIGYQGRITEDTMTNYSVPEDPLAGTASPKSLTDFGYNAEELVGVKSPLDLGYNVDDLVGVEGIEKSMEAYLTGNRLERQGKQEVEIDNMMVVQNVISSTEPMQGYNVMLTLDIPLQLAVEQSLATNIPLIRAQQEADFLENKGGKYDGLMLDDLDLAESGAAVVMDVNNGEVLAMASYPSFDLNLFTGGIADDVYKEMLKNTATPLFNKAVSSRATPGSIFKMVTGLAALMEGQTDPAKGTTLTEKISCEGKYTKDILNIKDAPSCWKKSGYQTEHADQDIKAGLEHSCNFYFYTLAGRLGIDLLGKWSDKFGLTSSTGIELPGEAIGQVGNQKLLFDPDKPIDEQATSQPMLVMATGKYSVKSLIEEFAKTREVAYTDEEISKAAEEIVYLMGIEWKTNEQGVYVDDNGVTMGQRVRNVLSESLGLSTKITGDLSSQIASVLLELHWTPTATVATGIGQSITQVTPIAVARYVAAVVNGGTVYEAHVVDKVVSQDGTVILDKQPVVYDTLDAPQEFLDKIVEGMSSVVSAEEGTAADYFKDWKYQLDIGGKTGTAQVSTIDLENNSWFVCFAPFDIEDPTVKAEIAVVVYVPHGYKGGLSTMVAKDIIQYYMEQKEVVAEQTIPDPGSIVY